MRLLLCGVLYGLATTGMCHPLLTDRKTQSQRSIRRSEHLISSPSLNLTHTYVTTLQMFEATCI